jgi:hypothetical protein
MSTTTWYADRCAPPAQGWTVGERCGAEPCVAPPDEAGSYGAADADLPATASSPTSSAVSSRGTYRIRLWPADR